MWNYIVQIIGQKRGMHQNPEAQSAEAMQEDPRSGIGNERKQFGKMMGPTAISKMSMLTDTDQMKNIGASYAGAEAAGASGAAELGAAADIGSIPAAETTALSGASGALELEGAGGLPKPASTGLYSMPESSPRMQGMFDIESGEKLGQAPPGKLDVMGGEEYGAKAKAAAEKTDPGIMAYIEDAMKNYAREKWGKKIGGKLNLVAGVADRMGEGGKSEFGGGVQKMADWFTGDTDEKRKQRKQRGLYAY